MRIILFKGKYNSVKLFYEYLKILPLSKHIYETGNRKKDSFIPGIETLELRNTYSNRKSKHSKEIY